MNRGLSNFGIVVLKIAMRIYHPIKLIYLKSEVRLIQTATVMARMTMVNDMAMKLLRNRDFRIIDL